MGGPGSGRWHRPARHSVSDYPREDIRALYRAGQIPVDSTSLEIQFQGNYRPQYARLFWAPCHYGGAQPWFVCPRCDRHTAVLHYRADRWACRVCHHLCYPSQRETETDRVLRRIRKIRQRLGTGGRPRYMHQRTYLRLTAERDAVLESLDDRFLNAH